MGSATLKALTTLLDGLRAAPSPLCVEWRRGVQHGYGRVTVAGRARRAHRVAWSIMNGAIPEGLCVCHRCDNRCCVNPAHLFLGSQLDNIADRDSKNRQAQGPALSQVMHRVAARAERNAATRPGFRQGIRNGRHKLTEDQARHVRVLVKTGVVSKSAIGRAFGISNTHVGFIASGKSWGHLWAS